MPKKPCIVSMYRILLYSYLLLILLKCPEALLENNYNKATQLVFTKTKDINEWNEFISCLVLQL